MAGAVRRGGELVSLDKAEYGMWTILLTPMTPREATEIASKQNWGELDQVMLRLRELDLVVKIEPGKAMDRLLGGLRPLPLGLGLGNNGDPTRFEIQNAGLSLAAPVSLDAAAVMFWWEFDGASSLQEISSRVAARLPEMSVDKAEVVLTELVHGLMGSRLIYLDHAARG